jgi:glycosyltransferase involved in cell wall biosynthesis
LAQYYGLENKVTWHGYVEDIGREIWAKNHLLLMPSLYEGCPISLYDAALFRRPAVVSDVGGNAEFVMEGENGFVSAAPTAVDFGRALERAWASRFQWKQMGEAARNRAIDHVDAEPELKVCEILENLTANACR